MSDSPPTPAQQAEILEDVAGFLRGVDWTDNGSETTAGDYANDLDDVAAALRRESAPNGRPLADVNDGGFGEAAYCHHRHHLNEHSTNFDTCQHSICSAARAISGIKIR